MPEITDKRPGIGYKVVKIPEGARLFEEGELGREMYIVQQGQIEISQEVSGEERRIAVLEKGDFFGEMSVLEDMPRAATARALTDCRLIEVNAATFDHMLRSNLEIAVRMLRKLSRRLRETDRLLKDALGTELGRTMAPEIPSPEGQVRKALASERLAHEKSGMEFNLVVGDETSIGRKDPVTGIDPDIDLTPVDSQRSVSRSHAKIYRKGSKLFLSEEIGTMNGTFLNGKRLEKGVPVEVTPGDVLRCGLVDLVFRAS